MWIATPHHIVHIGGVLNQESTLGEFPIPMPPLQLLNKRQNPPIHRTGSLPPASLGTGLAAFMASSEKVNNALSASAHGRPPQ